MFMALAAFAIGCGQPNDKAHPIFRKAERLADEGKFAEAAKEYERYLDVNRDSPSTHYNLAEIYYDQLDDPLLAAYHFRRFLELEPDASDREAIQKWIEEAENRIAKRALKRSPDKFAANGDFAKYKEHERFYLEYIRRLRAQNAEFRRRIEDLRKGGMAWSELPERPSGGEAVDAAAAESGFRDSSVWTPTGRKRPYPLKESVERKIKPRSEPASATASASVWKTYTVQPGDNLCKISKKFYGTTKRYKLIFEANKDVLKSESSLSIGQKLRIPRAPESGRH